MTWDPHKTLNDLVGRLRQQLQDVRQQRDTARAEADHWQREAAKWERRCVQEIDTREKVEGLLADANQEIKRLRGELRARGRKK